MAVKKSELYSSLWASCDELRGGMDASEYKDYVLLMLFIKYISDKYDGVPYAPITVPPGASFRDMVALKGNKDIGDLINKKIIAPIELANPSLGSIRVDFDNPEKLGTGDEKVRRLSNLIAIFEKPELNFSKNKAEGDDILGDAYEYLMRHFATESGKSKGQFYTPAEVSRIMAKIIGISPENSAADTTVYDPTCGSGSLLLKVAAEAGKAVSIYGQEKESTTAGLARMNMVLHGSPTALIRCTGNSTLSDPQFRDEDSGGLKLFDYIVANPPFSSKNWSNGLQVDTKDADPFGRFSGFGIPPAKNGDYAFLLHMLRSLKSRGKAAVILPHGVLFRGNAEADIRRNLVRKGYIRGIIGLPANLFYGTGIPACLIVLDKEHAASRKAIFMVDASKGFAKDGPKNRLRDQDIHKIVDVFNKQQERPGYSRIVPLSEIAEKDYNLNLPRYIDSQEDEDHQDIAAHLQGGIPAADVAALAAYWDVYPSIKSLLFTELRPGYFELKVARADIRSAIFGHPEFAAYSQTVQEVFAQWRQSALPVLQGLEVGIQPKKLIHTLSEGLLAQFSGLRLIDPYDVYQHLMTYWNEAMQDDAFVISEDGWAAGRAVYRITKVTKDAKSGKTKEKEIDGVEGIGSKLIKPGVVIARYFAAEQASLESLEAERDALNMQLEELEEEHGGDEGLLADARNDKDKITAQSVKERMRKLRSAGSMFADASTADTADEKALLEAWLKLNEAQAEVGRKAKTLERALEEKLWKQYQHLTDDEIRTLVVEDTWLKTIADGVDAEMQRISQRLTRRVTELADRYDLPLPAQMDDLRALEANVAAHLHAMGYIWN